MKEKEVEITQEDASRLASLFRSLGVVGVKVLLYLYFYPYKRVVTISRSLGYRYQTISDVINKLYKRGLLKKKPSGYALTKSGRILVEAMIELTAEVKNERA